MSMSFDADGPLDRLGWQILRVVQEDARLSLSEIGRRVGLSAPAVADRVRRMEELGIIAGYSATVDPTKLGYPNLAFIHLTLWSPDAYGEVEQTARSLSEVLECHHLTGADTYLFKVIVSSNAHLETVIATLGQFGQTKAELVLSSPVKSKLVYGGPSVRIG